MNYNIRNVRIFATPAADSGGINIYLDFSGQREYLIFYRFNYKLYMLLKNGISLDELTRTSGYRAASPGDNAMIHSVKQLMRVIDDYIKYEYLPYKKAG